MKKGLTIFFITISLLAVTGYGFLFSQPKVIENVPTETPKTNVVPKSPEKPKPPEVRIKESAQLAVPYTVQAPFGNWTVHEESCEEASALMINYFLKKETKFSGSTIIPPTVASSEMVKMKQWQLEHYGKEPDLTMENWGKFAKDYYGLKFTVFKNVTIQDIKKEISKGNPVVVPIMSHSLNNPHYGPTNSYHVLVVKGYKAEGVITNDPGIKEGENYFYSWNTLFKAVDAQTPKMGQGREMVILSK